jgi:hypothetical protein
VAKVNMKVGTISVLIETIGEDALLQFATDAGAMRTLRLVEWEKLKDELKRISGQSGAAFMLLVQEFLKRIIATEYSLRTQISDNDDMQISPETLECVLKAHFPEIYQDAEARQ